MKNKINIAELLENCPQGMKLYSPLCGTCVFDRLNMGTIICKTQNTQEITFTSEGYYMIPVFDDCECMIFPSKDQRDWNKFHIPFKVGDIIQDKDGYKVEIISVDIDDECYIYQSKILNGIGAIDFKDQDEWELVPNKFDISMLVPFESKVLVRDHKSQTWRPAIWGFFDENCGNHLYGVVGGNCFAMCIPFEGNEHLRGKIGDCDKFYQTWKE